MTRPLDRQEETLDDTHAQVVGRVRRLMTVSTVIMVGAVLLVLGVIVQRLFAEREPPVPAELRTALPAGARVLSTAIGEGRLAVTVETDDAVEVRLFDLKTLQPRGRLLLAPGR